MPLSWNASKVRSKAVNAVLARQQQKKVRHYTYLGVIARKIIDVSPQVKSVEMKDFPK